MYFHILIKNHDIFSASAAAQQLCGLSFLVTHDTHY